MASTPADGVRPRRWRRWRVRVLGGLAAATIVLLAAHAAFNAIAGVKLDRTLARLRAEGLPTRAEEVLQAPVPPERNGAVPLRAAFALLDGDSSDEAGTAALVRAVVNASFESPARDAAVMRAKVESPALALVYEKVYQAAESDTANFDYEVGTVPTTLLAYLRDIRTLAQLLEARVWLRADQGDYTGALADIRVGLRLGHLLKQEPMQFSQLVRMAAEAIAAYALRHPLDQARAEALPAEAVAAVVQELQAARAASRAAIVRGFDGEMVLFGGPCFEEWLGRRPPMLTVGSSPGGIGNWVTTRGMRLYTSYPLRPLVKLDYCEYLDIMADCRRNLSKPYWEVAPEARSWPFGHDVPRWCVLTRALASQGWFPKAAEMEADLLLAEVALALDQYRHAKRQYPADLSELGLVPAPVDPFTGKGLLYRRTDSGGAVVYSVGRDGADDGGKIAPPNGMPLDRLWELKP